MVVFFWEGRENISFSKKVGIFENYFFFRIKGLEFLVLFFYKRFLFRKGKESFGLVFLEGILKDYFIIFLKLKVILYII